ncbi:protein takeout-like [Calliphora vicina]|uniref:protein takeout-like n=1 Tax=Calliphora vicina TaxID=7373 RepID=UPI00325AA0B6
MRTLNFNLIITILVYKLFAVYGGDLPPEIQNCKSTDNDECIARTIEEIFKRYPNGNADFGMPSVAALNFTNLKISRPNPSSSIQINFEFIKCTMYGLENVKILHASGFDKELKKPQLDILIPKLRITGYYESTGKLLLLPLNGKGNGDIELRESKFHASGKLEIEKRNGKNYGKIKSVKAAIEPKQVLVKVENIFNGNPILSETINDVVNENWRDVWSELQEGINNAMEMMITQIMSGIFNELSIDDFYSD